MQEQEKTWLVGLADDFKACVEDIWSLEVNTCIVSEIGGYKFNPISCYENIYNIPVDLEAFRQALLPDDYEVIRATSDPEEIQALKTRIEEKFEKQDNLPSYIVTVFRRKLLSGKASSDGESGKQLEGLEPLDHLETTMKNYILIRDRLRRAYRSFKKLKGQTQADGEILPDISQAVSEGLLSDRPFLREMRSLRELYYLVGGKDAADSTNINDLISAQTIIQMDGDVMNRFHKALFNEPEKDFLVKTHQSALVSGQENWKVTVHGGGSSRPLALDRTQTVALISARDSLRCFLHLPASAILTGRRHRLRCGRYWSS